MAGRAFGSGYLRPAIESKWRVGMMPIEVCAASHASVCWEQTASQRPLSRHSNRPAMTAWHPSPPRAAGRRRRRRPHRRLLLDRAVGAHRPRGAAQGSARARMPHALGRDPSTCRSDQIRCASSCSASAQTDAHACAPHAGTGLERGGRSRAAPQRRHRRRDRQGGRHLLRRRRHAALESEPSDQQINLHCPRNLLRTHASAPHAGTDRGGAQVSPSAPVAAGVLAKLPIPPLTCAHEAPVFRTHLLEMTLQLCASPGVAAPDTEAKGGTCRLRARSLF